MNFAGVNFSIHREGFRFIGIGVALAVISSIISSTLMWFFILLSVFVAFFFRNPKRGIPDGDELIVSPSDGTVTAINLEEPPVELGLGSEKRYRVSVFLSVLNVHVNRTPASGKIKQIIYQPGSFLNAALDKASVFNEKNTIIMETNGDQNNLIAFTQIAGMIARRIVCDVHEGQEIKKGDIFGLIRFGSRCDVWLPVGVAPIVFKGQTMIGGETVIADTAKKDGQPRTGEIN